MAAPPTEEAIEAVHEHIPKMEDLMLATLQHGSRVFDARGRQMGKVVGGFPQGDPAVPVWFGGAPRGGTAPPLGRWLLGP